MSRLTKTLIPLVALAVLSAGLVSERPVHGAEAFEFVALGDMPYELPDDYARFDRLIAAINTIMPAFSIHLGDTKAGSTPCGDEALKKVKDQFMTFAGPLIYTPGDNEWTDCHRKKAGEYDPRERLAFVRTLHFSEAKSLGGKPMPLTRQSDVGKYKDMVENARWVHGSILFATVHVVGSNNGFGRDTAADKEYLGRNEANIAWIKETFTIAKRENRDAVVFAFQANLNFDERHGGDSGFGDTLRAFVAGAKAFAKTVLLVQGDSHEFIVDQPLKTELDDGERLENVYRLQVMGAREVQAVRVGIHPGDPVMFSFRPLIVKENINPLEE